MPDCLPAAAEQRGTSGTGMSRPPADPDPEPPGLEPEALDADADPTAFDAVTVHESSSPSSLVWIVNWLAVAPGIGVP